MIGLPPNMIVYRTRYPMQLQGHPIQSLMIIVTVMSPILFDTINYVGINLRII